MSIPNVTPEAGDKVFDSIKTIMESLLPETTQKLKQLMDDALASKIDSRLKSAISDIQSKQKIAENQFNDFISTLKSEYDRCIKSLENSKEGAVKDILKKTSKILKELGAPADVQKLIDNLPKLLDSGKTLQVALNDWHITKKELIAILSAFGSIITFIVTFILPMFV